MTFAWLLEDAGRYFTGDRWSYCWDCAVRFARATDANAMKRLLNLPDSAVAVEHGWDDGKPSATEILASSPDDVAQYFAFEHLPAALQGTSRPFGELAAQITVSVPRNAQRTIALNKLLEAKDAAVRATLPPRKPPPPGATP